MTTEQDSKTTHIVRDFCARKVAKSYLNQHYKTKVCMTARENAIPYEQNKSNEVLDKYKAQNQRKKQKALDTIGADALRLKQKLARRIPRAKNKNPTEPNRTNKLALGSGTTWISMPPSQPVTGARV